MPKGSVAIIGTATNAASLPNVLLYDLNSNSGETHWNPQEFSMLQLRHLPGDKWTRSSASPSATSLLRDALHVFPPSGDFGRRKGASCSNPANSTSDLGHESLTHGLSNQSVCMHRIHCWIRGRQLCGCAASDSCTACRRTKSCRQGDNGFLQPS